MGKVLDILRFQEVMLAAAPAAEPASRADRPRLDRQPSPVVEPPAETPRDTPVEEAIPFFEVPELPEQSPTPVSMKTPASGVEPVVALEAPTRPASKAKDRFAPELVVALDPDGPASAAYAQVANALCIPLAGEQRRTLLIAPLLGSDHGAVVSANLALALATKDGRKVLLIDADPGQRRLATLFNAASGPGWGDLLAGARLPLAIQPSGRPGLHLIAAGNRLIAAHAAFRAERLRGLLQRLQSGYDAVLVKSPVWSELRIPSVLAHACDAVCLLVSRKAADSSFALGAAEWLREEGIRLLGSIVLPE